MTPDEYQAVIVATRVFARIQVRQQTRRLAADYGVPESVLDGPTGRRFEDRMRRAYAADTADVRREWLARQHLGGWPRAIDPQASVAAASVA